VLIKKNKGNKKYSYKLIELKINKKQTENLKVVF